MPKNAETDAEIDACFDVMSELRPDLKRDTFLATIRSMQADGYRLAFISENDKPVAAAGYRILSNLHYGKYLYVDDLVTAADTRSTGQGKAMLAWLTDLALAENCVVIHLDSGTQRAEAHKFYFREGFNIASYHFARLLG
jgi:GNAT superfamily N-acetyltransferase